MIRIEEYISEGTSPFRRWFDDLDAQAAAAVTVAIERLAEGNTPTSSRSAKVPPN
jgi:hypothetical protein